MCGLRLGALASIDEIFNAEAQRTRRTAEDRGEKPKKTFNRFAKIRNRLRMLRRVMKKNR